MKSIFLLLLVVWSGNAAEQQTNKTVFPSQLENQNGNSQDAIFGGGVSVYQELFRASTLANSWKTPVKITSVAFRVGDGGSQSFDAIIPRVEIRFSTSQRAPEQMSSLYAANRGQDELVVYRHDNVRIFATGNQAPNPFEVKFQFDTPFLYDPNAGHLLMYLAHDNPTLPSDRTIDSHSFGELNSTVPFASFGGGGFVSPVAHGVVAQFESSVVPEPSSVAFFVIGTILIAGLRSAKKSDMSLVGAVCGAVIVYRRERKAGVGELICGARSFQWSHWQRICRSTGVPVVQLNLPQDRVVQASLRDAMLCLTRPRR